MLDSLRKAAGTWIAKLLLLLLVASFAVWGISGQMVGGLTGNAVITAGDTTVTAIEYRLAYDRQISVLSQRFGQPITREQAVALGIDNQVLAQLVSGAVLDEQARQMGLGLSKQRLAELTADDPAFQGPDGRFDRARFEFVLRQIGMRPDDYLKSRSQVAIRQQIVEAVSDGIAVPDAFLRAVAIYQGEDRTVEYVTLPGSVAGAIEPPDEPALQAWFDERKSNYRAPEYRKIAYVKLEPEDLADPESVTDQQVREDYERNIARYTTAERRQVQQLVFPTRQEAEAALEKIRGGAGFSEIVAGQGRTEADVSLGTVARSDIADPAIAEAAFALDAGEVSDVIDGAFGPVLVHVTGIEPEEITAFEDVREEIRREIAENEAAQILLDVYDQYEDARAAGTTLAETAERLGLTLRTVEAVDRTGRRPDGTVVDDLPESRNLLQNAFETESGVENPPIDIGTTGYLFYEVVSVTPARERELSEVRDQVLSDWTDAERSRLVAAKAAEIEEKIAGGTSFAEAIGELGLEVQTKYGLKRDTEDADFGEAGVEAVFATAVNGTGTVRGPQDNSWIVFRVTESFQPIDAGAESLPEDLRNALKSGLADDLLEQLIVRLQDEYGVTVNQAAIDRALSF